MPRAMLGALALLAVFVAAVAGLVPWLVAAGYAVMSGVSGALYASDKSAARRGAQRVAERTLHLADLLGGWPGALIAQQLFRHKTSKTPFQILFWLTVLANLAFVAWLTRGAWGA